MNIDIIKLGASMVRKGVALWSGVSQIGPDSDDIEPLPDGDVYQGLGVTSLPFPSDDSGHAEGVCVRGAAGKDVAWIGARDTRSANIVGNLTPGDTTLHSTGPQQAAQVQCKEKKRQVLMATKTSAGKTMMVMLDGTSNKIQFVLPGMMMEMDGGGKSFSITNGQASILMSGSTIALDGDVVLGGKVGDPVNKVMVSAAVIPAPLPCATGTGVVAIPVSAAKGISVAVG